jgi:hypothetical protein
MTVLGWAALAFCLASCSSAPGGPQAGKAPSPATAGSDAQPAPRPEGSVDANPSDPPLVVTGSRARAMRESLQRMPPPRRNLPTGWSSASWFAQVRSAAGRNGVKHSFALGASASEGSELGWDWSAPGVKSISAGAGLDAHKNPIALTCDAQGFDPADQQAVEEIASVFMLCTSAEFPGADRAAASRWVDREEALMLADFKARPRAREILSTTPSFGPAVYSLQLGPVQGFGNTFLLKVM